MATKPADTKLSSLKADQLNALADRLQNKEFKDVETKRAPIEIRWMQYLRQYKAKYDPDIKFDPNQSKTHPGFTRGMVNSLYSLLTTVVPDHEKDWSLKPTPVPSVDPAIFEEIVRGLAMQSQNGKPRMVSQQEILDALRTFTEARCASMSDLIADQLVDDGYREKDNQAKFSGILYGTGVIKGPLSERMSTKEVRKNPQTNKWEIGFQSTLRPSTDFVPLWRFYPDMMTTDPLKCNFAYQLHAMTAHEMRRLAGTKELEQYFLKDTILAILKNNPSGNYKLRSWEALVQAESETKQVDVNTNNYEVLERNGYLSGHDFYEIGLAEEDQVDQEIFCSIWMCDQKVIGVWQWPDYMDNITDLYHIYYYTKDETSIFGTGLAEIIRDNHLGIAACARNKMDNASWITAPCGEININSNLLATGQGKTLSEWRPRKFILKNAAPNFAQIDIMKFYHMESRIEELTALEQQEELRAYKSSSLPLNMSSLPPQDIGLKEAARQLQNFSAFIKRLIKNFDCAKSSTLKGFYHWNMKFSDRADVKGDMQVETTGTFNIIMKEAAIDQIAFLIQSGQEWIKKYLRVPQFLTQLLKSSMPNPGEFIKSEAEVAKEDELTLQQQQQIQQLQQQLMQIEGQLSIEKAKNAAARTELTQAKAEQVRATTPHQATSAELDNLSKAADISQKHAETAATQVEAGKELAEPVRPAP